MCVSCTLLFSSLLFCFLEFSVVVFFFFKQKTAYEMRISDWSSDVCSSDLFFGIVNHVLLWITLLRPDALAGEAFGKDLQPRGQRAAGQQRVFGDLLEGVQTHDLNGLGRVAQSLADELQVVRVELHRLEWSQGLVVQNIEVAENTAGRGEI